MRRARRALAPARSPSAAAGRAALAINGGSPVRLAPWPTYDKGAVFIDSADEQAALRAIRSHLYFRYDYRSYAETECGKFERELCRCFGSKHALATSSGTTAPALAIMAADVPPGSLIACQGFTFAATPSAILLAGCRPFLVEVDEDLHMDVADLARRWTPEIKAIVVVHMRGFAADMAALTSFADRMNVPVIEDAVPALGAEFGGRKLAWRASPFVRAQTNSIHSLTDWARVTQILDRRCGSAADKARIARRN